jgi:hypothetical protein
MLISALCPTHHQRMSTTMPKFISYALASLFAATLLFTQVATAATAAGSAPTASDCASKAVGKDGKPLAGAAKTSFMKKCEADAKGPAASACAEKAVDKNGKALAGAAKTSFMKKCEADTKAAK